jgi:hypothetical protein
MKMTTDNATSAICKWSLSFNRRRPLVRNTEAAPLMADAHRRLCSYLLYGPQSWRTSSFVCSDAGFCGDCWFHNGDAAEHSVMAARRTVAVIANAMRLCAPVTTAGEIA